MRARACCRAACGLAGPTDQNQQGRLQHTPAIVYVRTLYDFCNCEHLRVLLLSSSIFLRSAYRYIYIYIHIYIYIYICIYIYMYVCVCVCACVCVRICVDTHTHGKRPPRRKRQAPTHPPTERDRETDPGRGRFFLDTLLGSTILVMFLLRAY